MHQPSGRTLIEVAVASALAILLFLLATPASMSSVDTFRIAERRSAVRSDLRRAFFEIEHALRRTDREGSFPALRIVDDLLQLTLAPGTPGGALYLNQYTSFNAATRRAVYGDAVAFYVAPDPQNGGNALYKKTWTGTLDLTALPARIEKIATGVVTPTPFVDDGATVKVVLELERSPVRVGKDVIEIRARDVLEVHID